MILRKLFKNRGFSNYKGWQCPECHSLLDSKLITNKFNDLINHTRAQVLLNKTNSIHTVYKKTIDYECPQCCEHLIVYAIGSKIFVPNKGYWFWMHKDGGYAFQLDGEAKYTRRNPIR